MENETSPNLPSSIAYLHDFATFGIMLQHHTTNMSEKIVREISLIADKAAVWEALINPEKTRLFMFNCTVDTDWKPGSKLQWKGNCQGYKCSERGTVLESEPGRRLKYTSFDPNFGLEDKKENYLHMPYDLKEAGNGTILITTIENFNGDTERTKHNAGGWDGIVLPALKNLFPYAALLFLSSPIADFFSLLILFP